MTKFYKNWGIETHCRLLDIKPGRTWTDTYGPNQDTTLHVMNGVAGIKGEALDRSWETLAIISTGDDYNLRSNARYMITASDKVQILQTGNLEYKLRYPDDE